MNEYRARPISKTLNNIIKTLEFYHKLWETSAVQTRKADAICLVYEIPKVWKTFYFNCTACLFTDDSDKLNTDD